ncbi:MAG: hypothetical protein AMJ89_01000 [candidate division Zixibacteria bacterium SM23_73]|nr:MAG: hypothetical protein AMJ89_01000 [candidate division Zixibacteria bacterium SM23_73]
MNKLHYKNPNNLRTDIVQLVNFRGEEGIVHSSPKVKDQNLSQLNMPSKYATVLTCSFEKDQRTDLDVKMLS